MEAIKLIENPQTDLQWLQVAHDLKSPLTALGIIAARLQTLPPDERQLIVHAIGRIQEIVVHVLRPVPVGSAPALDIRYWGPEALHALLKEKQLEFPHVKFRLEVTGERPVSERIPIDTMNRVLSNLLNNAAEANGGSGDIFVRVKAEDGYTIEIEDQGPGIPANIRNQIGILGATGKSGADCRRGIGLYSAFQFIKRLGGELSIADCNSSQGTLVRLDL